MKSSEQMIQKASSDQCHVVSSIAETVQYAQDQVIFISVSFLHQFTALCNSTVHYQ